MSYDILITYSEDENQQISLSIAAIWLWFYELKPIYRLLALILSCEEGPLKVNESDKKF